jgi:tryptophan-rich sensory protein
MNNFIKLILSLLFTIGIGSLGSVFTSSEIPNWYASLQKPVFNPPNWIFGPVWTILYSLMGVALYLVWKKPVSKDRNTAIVLFMIQFTLNFFWSIIFFKYHLLGWALVEILFMWTFIILTIIFFWKNSTLAASLLIPYLVWVSFATILNAAIFQLN